VHSTTIQARRATQHADEPRSDAHSATSPLLPQFTHFFLATSLFRTGDTGWLSLFPRPRSRSLVIPSASSVSLRIVALPAADAASRVNGPTFGRGQDPCQPQLPPPRRRSRRLASRAAMRSRPRACLPALGSGSAMMVIVLVIFVRVISVSRVPSLLTS
jgi:hypothetical protein